MNAIGDVKVLFIAGFGPVVREETASRRLYCEALVSRFLSPEGLLLGITFTPSMRDEKT
jgi:hypothetical protein